MFVAVRVHFTYVQLILIMFIGKYQMSVLLWSSEKTWLALLYYVFIVHKYSHFSFSVYCYCITAWQNLYVVIF